MTENTQYLYRITDTLHARSVDEFDNPVGWPEISVTLRRYPIVRRTPKGAWIDLGWDEEKFILLTAHKQWACETPELALESYKARKQRQISLLNAQLERARAGLLVAEQGAVEDGTREYWLVGSAHLGILNLSRMG